MKWIRVLGKAVIGLALVSILAFAALMGFMYWMTPEGHRGCSADSEAAEYARSLSQARLERLYTDMKKYYELNHEKNIDYTQLPEFSDLEVRTIRPWRSVITVEGCFDNYMHMNFQGISNQKEPSINLSCGELENECGNELLWPE